MVSTRSGHYELQPAGYRAFIPKPLPPEDLLVGPELQALLSRADLALGRLDGVVGMVPDPDLFVLQYVRREAVLSSQIEGTNASLMDVLEYEAELESGERRVDVQEVVNYIAAMDHGLQRLPAIPLSRRLLCEVHDVLMRGVRGGEDHKSPGDFRRSQNWIGGGSPATARFVPPPPDLVGDLFADLESFLHDPTPMPPLVKAGIAHAQFETIHPFLDGNGRTGRLLITFWLVERGILRKPLLYPSLYFKEQRDEYIHRLQAIRDDGAWESWLAFFIDGIAQVAEVATITATKVVELRGSARAMIASAFPRRAGRRLSLLDELFKRPLVTARMVQDRLGVSQPTASALLRDLVEIDVIEEVTGRRWGRRFAYTEYLELFPGRTERR